MPSQERFVNAPTTQGRLANRPKTSGLLPCLFLPRRYEALYPCHVDAHSARHLFVGEAELPEAFDLLGQAKFAAILHTPPLLLEDQKGCVEDTTSSVQTEGGSSRLMPG